MATAAPSGPAIARGVSFAGEVHQTPEQSPIPDEGGGEGPWLAAGSSGSSGSSGGRERPASARAGAERQLAVSRGAAARRRASVSTDPTLLHQQIAQMRLKHAPLQARVQVQEQTEGSNGIWGRWEARASGEMDYRIEARTV